MNLALLLSQTAPVPHGEEIAGFRFPFGNSSVHIKSDRPFMAFGSRVGTAHKDGRGGKLQDSGGAQPGLLGRGQQKELVPWTLAKEDGNWESYC